MATPEIRGFDAAVLRDVRSGLQVSLEVISRAEWQTNLAGEYTWTLRATREYHCLHIGESAHLFIKMWKALRALASVFLGTFEPQ